MLAPATRRLTLLIALLPAFLAAAPRPAAAQFVGFDFLSDLQAMFLPVSKPGT